MQWITNNSIKHQSFIYPQLNLKIVLFQTIQFSMSTQFNSNWPIGHYQVLPLRTRVDLRAIAIKGTPHFPSDCLVSYPGHLLGKSYPPAEMQSVYSTALADWANVYLYFSSLPVVSFRIQRIKFWLRPLGQELLSPASQKLLSSPSGTGPAFIFISGVTEFSRIFKTII